MKKQSLLLIIIASLLWGTSGIFVNYLSPYGITALQMTAIRGTVSVLAIGIYMLITTKRMAKQVFSVKARELPMIIAAGFCMFMTASCYYISMQLTSVATSVILMYTAPLFVTCYSVIFMKERLTIQKIIGIVSIFIGCAFVSGVVGGIKMNFWGVAIGLLSGISYSAYNIVTKIEMKRNVKPVSATFYCYVTMTVLALLVSQPSNIITVAMNNSINATFLMIGLGIFTFAMPYFLYTIALKDVSASLASSLGVIEPLSATVYSAVLFNEKLGVYQVLGILLVVGAILLLTRDEKNTNVISQEVEYEKNI